MKRILSLLLFPFLMLLSGCNPLEAGLGFADQAKQQIATTYIDHLIAGRHDKILVDLSPTLKEGDVGGMFAKMQEFFPPRTPTSRELIGYQVYGFSGKPTQYNITYQYGYGDKWLVVNVAFCEPSPGRVEIFGMRVVPLVGSLQETNRFTFAGKGVVHAVFLCACLCNVLFIGATLVACVRTRLKRRKWLWVIFVLMGVIQFSLNWTSGEWGGQPVSFQLFGASVMKSSVYAPWVLSFSLPVGAVVFWLRRKYLVAGAEPPPLSPIVALNSSLGESTGEVVTSVSRARPD